MIPAPVVVKAARGAVNTAPRAPSLHCAGPYPAWRALASKRLLVGPRQITRREFSRPTSAPLRCR